MNAQFADPSDNPSAGEPIRWRLSPAFAIIPMSNGVQLRAGDEQIHLLETDGVGELSRLLERLQAGGTHEQLVAITDSGGDRELVDELLGELDSQQLLLPAAAFDGRVDELARYLQTLYPAAEPERLAAVRQATVEVVGENATAELLRSVLAEYGLAAAPETAGDGGSASVRVCVVERPDLAFLLDCNRSACDSSRPCLFVDLSHGSHATIGPFFIPGEGGCYRCFRDRLRENTAALSELEAAEEQMLGGGPLPACGCPPGFRHQVAGVAAGEVFALLTGHRPLRTLNRAATLDFEGLRIWTEPVWRIPWCEACGDAAT